MLQSGRAFHENISSPDFIRLAGEVGFSRHQVFEAEAALRSKGDADTPALPRRMIAAMVNRHGDRKPWRGPLPKPRRSSPVRLGDI